MRYLLTALLLILPTLANAAYTEIAAKVIRNQAGSGSTFISCGFPLPEGLVSEADIEAGTQRILVNGTEVAANVTALRGRHNDGTLRAMLIQFTVASMAQNDEITAQVIVDTTERTYEDPIYILPTFTHVQNMNLIVPTSAAYLSSTQISLRQLVPEGGGSAEEENMFTALAEDRALNISNSGTASYEHPAGLIALWARTADATYLETAISYTIADDGWLERGTPATGVSPDCQADTYVNPDSRTIDIHSTCGIQAEWNFSRIYSFAQLYLLTGYRDFWALVAYNAQIQQASVTSLAIANSDSEGTIKYSAYDLPRMNYMRRIGAMIPAYMIDATMPISGQYVTARQLTFADQMSWIVASIIEDAWDIEWIPFSSGSGTVPALNTTISQGAVSASLLGVYAAKHDPQTFIGQSMPASGYLMIENRTGGSFSSGALTGISASATGAQEDDYRNGFIGTLPFSPREVNRSPDTVIPIFQSIFVLNYLIDYYLYVYADSTIPAVVKTNLDIMLQNVRLMVPGDTYYGISGGAWGDPLYGQPYELENPVSSSDAEPWSLPEYLRIIAFVLKTSGEATVNGANYTTWYSRFLNTGNISPSNVLIWQWKNFGQFFGWGLDAPWIMDQTAPAGPSTFAEPTYYSAIPSSTPDVYRTASGGGSQYYGSRAGSSSAGITR